MERLVLIFLTASVLGSTLVCGCTSGRSFEVKNPEEKFVSPFGSEMYISEAIDVYKQLADVRVYEAEEDAFWSIPSKISIPNQPGLTRGDAWDLLEKALREQAGIIVTHPDMNREVDFIKLSSSKAVWHGDKANSPDFRKQQMIQFSPDNDNGYPVSDVIDMYEKLSDVKVFVDERARQKPGTIHIEISKPLTHFQLTDLLEKALREQAGIVATRPDVNRVTVLVTVQPSSRQSVTNRECK